MSKLIAAPLVRSILTYLAEHGSSPFSDVWQAMQIPNEHTIRRALDAMVAAALVQVSHGETSWIVRGAQITGPCRRYRLTAKGKRAAASERPLNLSPAEEPPRQPRPLTPDRLRLRQATVDYLRSKGASSLQAIVEGLGNNPSDAIMRSTLRDLVAEGALVSQWVVRQGQARAPRTGMRPARWRETVWEVAKAPARLS